jgi:hypothetical protein
MTINVPSDQATTVVMSFTAADPQGRIVAVLARGLGGLPPGLRQLGLSFPSTT